MTTSCNEIPAVLQGSAHPSDNASSDEPVPGRRAEDFGLRGFASFLSAQAAVEKAIHHNNAIRPHASLGYLTPNQRTQGQGR